MSSKPKFAIAVEPTNPDFARYIDSRDAHHRRRRATLHSSISRERPVNPFLRCAATTLTPGTREHGASREDRIAVLAAFRQWNNNFR